MHSTLPNIRRAISSMKWAIIPEKLEQMIDVVEARAALGRPFTEEEIQERMAAMDVEAPRPHAARRTVTKQAGGKIAVLRLTGLIMPKSSMVNGMSTPAGTSCEQFAADLDAAANDSSISHIVIDVDSPGGSVVGVPELSDRVYEARKKKQITAVANGLAASAAYWIASAANELVVIPSGEVGSIGVFVVHEEGSELFAKAGIKHTIIKAGEYKAEGNIYEPLSPEAKEAIQEDVDAFYEMFTTAVARNRGVGAKTVDKNFGKGRCVLAKNAVAAGMADRVETLESVLAKLGVSKEAYDQASNRHADDVELPIAAEMIDTPIKAAAVADVAAAAGIIPLHGSKPAPKGQEFNVPENMAPASPSGAEMNATELLAAERTRVTAITALCGEHGIDANVASGMVTRGISVSDAKGEILDLKRAQNAKAPRITGGHDRASDRPFDSLGEQLVAVVNAGKGRAVDPRLNRMATASGMNETVGSEGGFLVDPEFLPGLTKVVFDDDPILSRVKRIPSSKPQVKYNVLDETSRATGSRAGGVQVYWEPEAETATAKKPKLRKMVLEKKKVMGICYLTDELQDDAPAAQAIVSDAFGAELRFTIANAIFRGTGAGQPFGFLNSGATASVAIESGQTIANTAASIAVNTSKMLARVPASLWGEVIWLYNQELFPKLAVATVGGSSGAVPVFMGAGGMSGKPFDTIWGRPAYASELCEAEGTAGDIIAIAPSQYAVLGGDQTKFSESIHVRFLYDENCLKFTTRVDGAPEWVSTITRFKGGSALSPFVTLAARS